MRKIRRVVICAFFVLLVSTSLVFAQKSRDFTVYDPDDAIHPS